MGGGEAASAMWRATDQVVEQLEGRCLMSASPLSAGIANSLAAHGLKPEQMASAGLEAVNFHGKQANRHPSCASIGDGN